MPIAHMAVQFHNGKSSNEQHDEADWVETGFSAPSNVLTNSFKRLLDNDVEVTVPDHAWGEVVKFSFGVDREYGGINSSGGPQHSGRPDHRLVTLDRETDKISPLLFKRCCNGMQLKRVIIYAPDFAAVSGGGVVLYLEDCHVVNFGCNIYPYWNAYHRETSKKYRDQVTILYTKISFKVADSTYGGWDTGQEISFNEGP